MSLSKHAIIIYFHQRFFHFGNSGNPALSWNHFGNTCCHSFLSQHGSISACYILPTWRNLLKFSDLWKFGQLRIFVRIFSDIRFYVLVDSLEVNYALRVLLLITFWGQNFWHSKPRIHECLCSQWQEAEGEELAIVEKISFLINNFFHCNF